MCLCATNNTIESTITTPLCINPSVLSNIKENSEFLFYIEIINCSQKPFNLEVDVS
jgi:hypothetical protein